MQFPINYSIPILYIGRFTAGLSAGLLGISESLLIESWFKGKELLFALKVDMVIARIAWGISGIIQIFYFNISKTLLCCYTLGIYASLLSFIVSIILLIIDTLSSYPKFEKSSKRKAYEFSSKDLHIIPYHIWILAFASSLFYIAFYCNHIICSGMLQDRFGHKLESASICMSIPIIISVLFIPIFEALINKLGGNSLILLGSFLLMAISHFAFAFLPQVPEPSYRCIVPLVFFGLSYSLFTSIFWRSINNVIDIKIQEVGVILITFIQGIFCTITPYILGRMMDFKKSSGNEYFGVSIFLFICSLICITLGIVNVFFDLNKKIHRKFSKSILINNQSKCKMRNMKISAISLLKKLKYN